MRIVVTAIAERTHLLPTIPVAWALKAAGHEVVLAVPPLLLDTAVATGLPVSPTGTTHRLHRTLDRLSQLESGADAPHHSMDLSTAAIEDRSLAEWVAFYREHVGLWWRLMNDPMVPDLVGLCRTWRPDLVLWEGITWAGAVAATACDIPHVRVLSGSSLLDVARDRFLALRADTRGSATDPLEAWLGGRLAMYGATFEETVVRGHGTLDYLPPVLRVNPERSGVHPVRHIPYNGRAVLPDWLRDPSDRPRVCVTLGQSSVQQTGRYGVGLRGLREILLGAAGATDGRGRKAEVVATVPDELHDELRPLPPTVRLTPFVPLDLLVPSCSAVVNHGGAATMCTVARHSVPQVVVPDDTYDERQLGYLLEQAGAGRLVEAADVTEDTVRAALETALADGPQRRAARVLGDQMAAMPAPSDVVALLQDIASSHTGVPSQRFAV